MVSVSRAPRQRVPVAAIAALLVMAPLASHLQAQAGPSRPPRQETGQSSGNDLSGAQSGGPGAAGGGANADFDSLIEMIQSTVATETWADNGGEADQRPFTGGGVFVDAEGTLRQVKLARRSSDLGLIRRPPQGGPAAADANPRRAAALRYISLNRLESEIARRQQAGEPLDESMLTLAGLRRVQFVFLYPESGDLVLAGPAGDWRLDGDGRIVSAEDDQPIVRLDDLLVLLRRESASPGSQFGCSITPRKQALARTQVFLDDWADRPLRRGQRDRWLDSLREKLGAQDISIFGIDPASRVARVLVEADYHMKLIGMGLEDSVAGVESYLDSLPADDGAADSPLSILRWWFAMSYRGLKTTQEHDAFEIVGQGPCVLSENEMLTQQGERKQTGKSDLLTAQFASSFTANFRLLCQKYPLYTELRNVFDLALVAALIHDEGLPERVGWQPALLLSDERLPLPQSAVPRQVDTVVNHRVINRRRFVAGISGGVLVEPLDVLQKTRDVEPYGAAEERLEVPGDLAHGTWWWDFASGQQRGEDGRSAR